MFMMRKVLITHICAPGDFSVTLKSSTDILFTADWSAVDSEQKTVSCIIFCLLLMLVDSARLALLFYLPLLQTVVQKWKTSDLHEDFNIFQFHLLIQSFPPMVTSKTVPRVLVGRYYQRIKRTQRTFRHVMKASAAKMKQTGSLMFF